MEGMLGRGIAVLIAISFALSLVFGFLAELVTNIACGARPEPESMFSGLWLAITGDPAVYAAPVGCELPVTGIRIVDLIAVLLMIALAIAGLSSPTAATRRRIRPSSPTSAHARASPRHPRSVTISRARRCCGERVSCGPTSSDPSRPMWAGVSADHAARTSSSRSRTRWRSRGRRDRARAIACSSPRSSTGRVP